MSHKIQYLAVTPLVSKGYLLSTDISHREISKTCSSGNCLDTSHVTRLT